MADDDALRAALRLNGYPIFADMVSRLGNGPASLGGNDDVQILIYRID